MDDREQTEPPDAAAFEAELRRRADAAAGLRADLLTEVPMLYGGPNGGPPYGDPGIAIAALHRKKLVRRNGGGISPGARERGPARLPFERALIVLVLVLYARLCL